MGHGVSCMCWRDGGVDAGSRRAWTELRDEDDERHVALLHEVLVFRAAPLVFRRRGFDKRRVFARYALYV